MVKHAVILMAGKGTRFLPATKGVAKEMFPIGSKPALLYHLVECLDSGIKEVTIVISKQKKDVIKFVNKNTVTTPTKIFHAKCENNSGMIGAVLLGYELI